MKYFEYLVALFPPAGHLCDLVAYFFRQAFLRIRRGGTFGLVATNSISQGDTRAGGLGWICNHDGTIYAARRRFPWPGGAAVVVSVVNVLRGRYLGSRSLDGKEVKDITAYLFHAGGNDEPSKISGANALFSMGSKIYGQGFLFDDNDAEASFLEEMRKILQTDRRYNSRILPYIGGEEVNQSPTQSPNRYVIFLSDLENERDLEAWPELARIVRQRVKPERDRLGDNPNNVPLRRRWWAYQAHRPEFYKVISNFDRVVAIASSSASGAFCFLPTKMIYSHALILFALRSYSSFAVLQSRVHDLWARFFGSSLKDDLRYTPSDCFETFPPPVEWETGLTVEQIGKEYYEFRANLMLRNNKGLTATYNRFHDPDERDHDIIKLRELHDAMDRVVLDAYGWTKLKPTCEFILDYEEEENDDGKPRRKKKPWRYRWPDEFRDEVLARLLALNQERAAEEKAMSDAGNGTKKKESKGGRKPRDSRTTTFLN